MTKKNDFGLLHKFVYPPYQIICNSLNSFIVCGGGGGSYKSGIPNKIEVYNFSRVNPADSTQLPILKNEASFDTNDKIVTSMSRHFNYLLTAEKNDLCEYIFINSPVAPTTEEEVVVKEENTDDSVLELKLHRKVVNCFEDREKSAEINLVKYCGHLGSFLVIGGSYGGVKIYQRYNDEKPMDLVLLREFPDVSDGKNIAVSGIDVSPNGEEFVSICDHPDGKYARVWNISRGVKVTELALMNPGTKKLPIKCAYKFKHCRYASTYFKSDRRPSFLLYTTHHPAKRDQKAPSFMSVWGPADPGSGNDYQLMDAVSLGDNKTSLFSPRVKLVPTALAVSGNGTLSSVGSGEGQVNVYRFNTTLSKLELIYRLADAHSFVVTDMAFMPSSRVLATGHEFELLSVGIDNMLRYHRQPAARHYLRLERLYCLLLVLAVMFFCDRLLLALNFL